MSTYNEERQNNSQSRNVVMVTYPGAQILDVVGPIEILTGTKLFVQQDCDPYVVTLVSDDAGAVP